MMMTTHAEMVERLVALAPTPKLVEIKAYAAFGARNLTIKWRGRAVIRIQVW